MCDTELAAKVTAGESLPVDEEWPSDEELRTELQALVVGVDLDAVTVGQMRALLERRLELEEGELGSRRLRRRVGQALRLEVAGRLRRDDDAEAVAKALVAYEACDAGARQLVIESLPLAAAGTSDYHLRFLAIARDLLLEGRHAAAAVLEEGRGRSSAAGEEETGSREAAAGPLAEKVATARALVAQRLAAQGAAERDEMAERREYEAIESEHGPVAVQRTRLRLENAKQRHAFISSCQVRILIDGSWTDEQEREAAIEALLTHFEATGAEAALATAMPAAFKRRPDDRRPFDHLTANAVEEAMAEEAAGLTTRLAALPDAAEAEATLLAAKATLTAATARVATLLAERLSAEAALASAVNERANEEAWAVEQAAVVSACALELAPVEQQVATIDRGLAALDRLRTPPAIAAEEVPEDAPMADAEMPEADAEASEVAATPARAVASQGEALTEKMPHPKALPCSEATPACDAWTSLEAVPLAEVESVPEAVSSLEAGAALAAEAALLPGEAPRLQLEPAADAESLAVGARTVLEPPETTAVAETMSEGGDSGADALTLTAFLEPEEEEAVGESTPEAVEALAAVAPASPAIAAARARDKSCERPLSMSLRRAIASPARSGRPLRRSGEAPPPLLPARCLSFETPAAPGSPVSKQAVAPGAPEHESAAASEAAEDRRPMRRRRKSCGDMSPAAA